MSFHWPQITYLCLAFLGLGIVAANHGKPQGKYSIWTSLFAFAITFTLLYFGGFFN
jgi:hypothetical protein